MPVRPTSVASGLRTGSAQPNTDGGRVGSGRREAFFLLLPLALTAYVDYPITQTYFFADDFFNFYRIVNFDLLDYLLRPHGGHLLLTRNALFYVFFHAYGLHAQLYFYTVLLTHLANAGLLFGIIRRLANSAHLASFGAALWGTCPAHADTLDWYSVYGQVVTASILLAILFQIAGIAGRGKPLSRLESILWPVLLLIGSTCFGVGIGIAMVSPAVCFLLLPHSSRPRRTWLCVALAALALALPFLYRAELSLYARLFGYTSEVFLAQMLPGAFRWRQGVLMLGLLFRFGIASLVLGFASLWNLGDLPTYLAGLFALAVATVVIGSRADVRRHIGALLLLSLACYGIIAAGRSSFFDESKVAAAALPRYQYVGSIPLAVILCLVLGRLGDALRPPPVVKHIALAGWAAIAVVGFAQLHPFINLHGPSRAEIDRVHTAVLSAIDAAPPTGSVYIPNQPFASIGYILALDQANFPGWAGVFTFLFPSNIVEGRPVYFVVDDPDVRKVASAGRRTEGLLVSPGDVRAPRGQPEPTASP